ncbi:hypothetical protein [Achromobacter sp. PAB15]|uniref:hypothetical protein n=1 Tax=Achromobacter sp. PAB15 TaxID=3233048 RepID=UPI003F9228B3
MDAALTEAQRILAQMDVTYWSVNLGIPLLVLSFNLVQRGLLNPGTASASSDWILLLVGIDFATVAMLLADKGAKLVHSPANFGPWILLLLAGGYATHAFSLKVIEPRIVKAVERQLHLPEGARKHERALAFVGVISMYLLSLALPLVATSIHILAYTIGK